MGYRGWLENSENKFPNRDRDESIGIQEVAGTMNREASLIVYMYEEAIVPYVNNRELPVVHLRPLENNSALSSADAGLGGGPYNTNLKPGDHAPGRVDPIDGHGPGVDISRLRAPGAILRPRAKVAAATAAPRRIGPVRTRTPAPQPALGATPPPGRRCSQRAAPPGASRGPGAAPGSARRARRASSSARAPRTGGPPPKALERPPEAARWCAVAYSRSSSSTRCRRHRRRWRWGFSPGARAVPSRPRAVAGPPGRPGPCQPGARRPPSPPCPLRRGGPRTLR